MMDFTSSFSALQAVCFYNRFLDRLVKPLEVLADRISGTG